MNNEQSKNATKTNQKDSKLVNKFEPSMIYETSREIVNSIDSKENREVLVKKYSSYINFK